MALARAAIKAEAADTKLLPGAQTSFSNRGADQGPRKRRKFENDGPINRTEKATGPLEKASKPQKLSISHPHPPFNA